MSIKESIEYYLEGISKEVSYLENLSEAAKSSFKEEHPEMKDDKSAGYPYMYGYISSGCDTAARKINLFIEEFKKEMGWKD